MKSLEERNKRDYERSHIVGEAVDAADRIILDGSDGSTEETNYLTSEVAAKLVAKALLPLSTAILRRDLED